MEKLCPKFEDAFEILGKRWTGLIIRSLQSGPKRFKDLEVMIPQLSARMLTARLKELEEHHIISRTVSNSTPVLIEYSLSEKGLDLHQAMDAVAQWAEKWN